MGSRQKDISSAPTNFCDNFYAQFFQNRMKQEITGCGKAGKESVVKLRLKVDGTEKHEIVLLITWFERYCDIRYDIFSEAYGGGSGVARAGASVWGRESAGSVRTSSTGAGGGPVA